MKGNGEKMKLRTRLIATFTLILILPLLLMVIVYFVIGSYMLSLEHWEFGSKEMEYVAMVDAVTGLTEEADEFCQELREESQSEYTQVESFSYLTGFNKRLLMESSYLVVKKGDEVYYRGDIYANANDKLDVNSNIVNRLPNYDEFSENTTTVFYYKDLQIYLNCINYEFADGTEGALYIVSLIDGYITESVLITLMIVIMLILIVVSYLLSKWIQSGVFVPIEELKYAMKSITEGDYDYEISSKVKGELGDVYAHYEQMRLRLKENEEQRIQIEKSSKELIRNITHDLKTPITSIKGYVEGIMDGVASNPEKMDKYIKTIYNKANDMDKLTNELSVYTKIDSNKAQYKFAQINVTEYFNDCVDEIRLELDNKNILLNYSNLLSKDVCIIADSEQLKRVINNIISNSIKYMDKEKGIIEIRLLDQIDTILIEMEDNAKGIGESDLTKIFERFYRTDASRNSSQGGSGIGLSIVKKIVEDHGGYIWATSEEGEGTCLHFVIRKHKERRENE